MALLLAISFAVEAATFRSQTEVWRFRKKNPCPSTLRVHGACPGWQIDHVIALKCGGADRPGNMQWLTVDAHKAKTKREAKDCRKQKH